MIPLTYFPNVDSWSCILSHITENTSCSCISRYIEQQHSRHGLNTRNGQWQSVRAIEMLSNCCSLALSQLFQTHINTKYLMCKVTLVLKFARQ